MELTANQKKYIVKNSIKMSPEAMAKAISIPVEEVRKLLGPESPKKEVVQKLENPKVYNKWWIFLSLAILVFISYFNSLNNGFVSDDIAAIAKNVRINDFGQYVLASFQNILNPLLYFSIAKMAGVNPIFFRLVNVIVHLINAWLVFLLISILVDKKAALITASLFAVHPIFIESVTWISGGPYARYTLFILLSLFLYIKSDKNRKYYFWSIISALISLLISEKSVVFFLIFIAFELSRKSLKKNWKRLVPYVFLPSFWILLYLSQIGGRVSGIAQQSYSKPMAENPLVQVPVAIGSYIQLIFWPSGLTLYHSELSFSPLQFAGFVLITLVLIAAIFWAYKKNSSIFFWLSLFIISLLPTLTPLNISWVVAERYVYLGAIGILFVAGYLLAGLIKNKKTKVIGYLLLAIFLIALLVRTIVRNMDWKNEDTLWLSMARLSASDPKTHNN
jgi:protein O-mannosyl-transferase